MLVVVVLLGSIRNKKKKCLRKSSPITSCNLSFFIFYDVLFVTCVCFVNLLRKFKASLNNVILKGEFL